MPYFTVDNSLPANRRNVLNPVRMVLRSFVAERWNRYSPKISIALETPKYLIKTAETWEEVEQAFTLRHGVFYRELLGHSRLLALDIDHDDIAFDHIIVIDKASNRCVGTYRLRTIEPNAIPYSAAEFNIDDVLALHGVKMEVGRACVHPEFRKTTLFLMLWKGIARYMQAIGCRWLFGCSSLHSMEKETVARVYRYLKRNNAIRDDLGVRPNRKYQVPHFSDHYHFVDRLAGDDTKDGAELVPPLMNFYLHCGARFCGEPAIDKKLRCTDFFTLLDRDALSKSAEEKFFGESRCTGAQLV